MNGTEEEEDHVGGCFILCCFKAIPFVFLFLRSYLQPFLSRAQYGILPEERWFGDEGLLSHCHMYACGIR